MFDLDDAHSEALHNSSAHQQEWNHHLQELEAEAKRISEEARKRDPQDAPRCINPNCQSTVFYVGHELDLDAQTGYGRYMACYECGSIQPG